jgi:hypothetical protein
VWQEEQTLLDGHNRLDICERHHLPYTTQTVSLPDIDAAKVWMMANQLGRRNLPPHQISYYRGEQYKYQKKLRRGGGDHKSAEAKNQKPHSEVFENTAQRLALQHNVSKATIERDAAYAKAIDTIADTIGPEARQSLLARDTKVAQREVKTLAKVATKDPDKAKEALAAVQGVNTPRQARQVVREAARQVRDHEQYMEAMTRSEGLAAWPPPPKPTEPADPLAARFRQTLHSMETLHMCLKMVTLPEALDPHMEACVALGKAYSQIQVLLGKHTAIRHAIFGIRPLPPQAAPAAPASQPDIVTRKDAGSLIQAVLLTLARRRSATCAALAKDLDEPLKRVHQALQELVKQGKARKEGAAYLAIPVPQEAPGE